MALLNITYDLNQPGQLYAGLISTLKSFPEWARPTKSQWIVKTSKTPAEVFRMLAQHLDKNDKLVVAPFNPNQAVWICDEEVSKWLKAQGYATV